jgi:hypothetical protein
MAEEEGQGVEENGSQSENQRIADDEFVRAMPWGDVGIDLRDRQASPLLPLVLPVSVSSLTKG